MTLTHSYEERFAFIRSQSNETNCSYCKKALWDVESITGTNHDKCIDTFLKEQL